MQTASSSRIGHQKAFRLVLVSVACSLLQPRASVADATCYTITNRTLKVPAQCTYVVSGFEAYNHVVVKNNGTIQIPAGAVLKVRFTLDVKNNGRIEFTADEPVPGLFLIENDVTMAGTFDGTGAVAGAISSIYASATLTIASSGRLMGNLRISTQFDMDGTVLVDDSSTITVDTRGPVFGSAGRWEVTHCGGAIVFDELGNADITEPTAHVLITAGTFECRRASFKTAGGLRMTGGTILAGPGFVFEARGAYSED